MQHYVPQISMDSQTAMVLNSTELPDVKRRKTRPAGRRENRPFGAYMGWRLNSQRYV